MYTYIYLFTFYPNNIIIIIQDKHTFVSLTSCFKTELCV